MKGKTETGEKSLPGSHNAITQFLKQSDVLLRNRVLIHLRIHRGRNQLWALTGKDGGSEHVYETCEEYDCKYQAGKWSHPRRVVFKIEKPVNQMTFLYTFENMLMQSIYKK